MYCIYRSLGSMTLKYRFCKALSLSLSLSLSPSSGTERERERDRFYHEQQAIGPLTAKCYRNSLLSVTEYDMPVVRHHAKRPLSGIQDQKELKFFFFSSFPPETADGGQNRVKYTDAQKVAFLFLLLTCEVTYISIHKPHSIQIRWLASYMNRCVSLPWICSSHAECHSCSTYVYVCVCMYVCTYVCTYQYVCNSDITAKRP